jgi:hypothetical protein
MLFFRIFIKKTFRKSFITQVLIENILLITAETDTVEYVKKLTYVNTDLFHNP